jgi:AmpE protein
VTFIALIIALGLLQYWGSAGPVHLDDWYRQLVEKVAASGLMAELQLGLAVLLPVLLVLWVQGLVNGWLFGLVSLGLTVLVLLYSFGRGDFESLVGRYREFCSKGDFESAYQFSLQELVDTKQEECPGSAEKLHRWVKQRISYLGFERWFGVIFYFALLGAAGALAYRLVHLYREYNQDAAQQNLLDRVIYWLDWAPSRLLVFTFAVTGDWVGSREQLMASLRDSATATPEIIADGAHAALGLKTTVFSSDNGDISAFAEVSDWEIGELQGLLKRSAMAWVVFLALLVFII